MSGRDRAETPCRGRPLRVGREYACRCRVVCCAAAPVTSEDPPEADGAGDCKSNFHMAESKIGIRTMQAYNKIALRLAAGDVILRLNYKDDGVLPTQIFKGRDRSMNSNPKLSYAIAAILSGSAAGFVHAAAVTDTESSDAIQEITVTAQRRSENIQNVPITIQALTADTLQQLNVTTFDDYIKYLPNVTGTVQRARPGQYLHARPERRLRRAASPAVRSADSRTSPSIWTISPASSRPATWTSTRPTWSASRFSKARRAPCSAPAPRRAWCATSPTSRSSTSPKATRSRLRRHRARRPEHRSVKAMLNLPLITDTLAVRAVIYNDRRGGYIDNVPGTFTRKDTDLGIYYAEQSAAAAGAGTTRVRPINNNAIAGQCHQSGHLPGHARRALYQINDDWNVLGHADLPEHGRAGRVLPDARVGSDGVTLSPLEVTLFNPSYDKDKFENTAWTVNGKIGTLEGGLYRRLPGAQRRSGQRLHQLCARRLCRLLPVLSAREPARRDPATTSRASRRARPGTRPSATPTQSHEFRLSTPDDWRVRGIVGAFLGRHQDLRPDELAVQDHSDLHLRTAAGHAGQHGLPDRTSGTAPGYDASNNPGVRNDNAAFFEDVTARLQADRVLQLGGLRHHPEGADHHRRTRYYHFDDIRSGSVTGSFGCFNAGTGRRLHRRRHQHRRARICSYNGIRLQEPRQLTWHVTAGHDGVLHLLAGLPSGRLQPQPMPATIPGTGRQSRSSAMPQTLSARTI